MECEAADTPQARGYATDTKYVQPSGDSCAETELHAGFVDAPARFVDSTNEMRLIPSLRDAAQTRDPYEILARSAAAFLEPDAELGNALADLAVTGRRSYCLLAHPPLTPLHDLQVAGAGSHIDLGTTPYTAAQLVTKVGGLLAPLVTATPAESNAAINTALDRAFRTAWAIRGPVTERSATRSALGWIAVSGEDDMPHRPVNVPGSPFEECELPVTVPARGSTPELTTPANSFPSVVHLGRKKPITKRQGSGFARRTWQSV